jgi:hypothetical protein
MNHLLIGSLVFVAIFGSALFGLYLRFFLPEHHLSDESVSVVKLATGLIATMAALVLGLLISSAKTSFDTINSEFLHNAASIIQLDHALAKYGPETELIRTLLKENYGVSIQILASRDASQVARLNSPEAAHRVEDLQRKIQELSPVSDVQRELKGQAIQIADNMVAVRWLALLQDKGSVPPALLVVLVCWLAIIFGAFGLFAPANTTIIAALFLGAFSTSSAIFMILEMNSPLDGVVRISLAPLRAAFAVLGQ